MPTTHTRLLHTTCPELLHTNTAHASCCTAETSTQCHLHCYQGLRWTLSPVWALKAKRRSTTLPVTAHCPPAALLTPGTLSWPMWLHWDTCCPHSFVRRLSLCLKLQNVKNTQILTSHSREGMMDSIGVPSRNEELISTENPHQKPVVGNNVKIFGGQKTQGGFILVLLTNLAVSHWWKRVVVKLWGDRRFEMIRHFSSKVRSSPEQEELENFHAY